MNTIPSTNNSVKTLNPNLITDVIEAEENEAGYNEEISDANPKEIELPNMTVPENNGLEDHDSTSYLVQRNLLKVYVFYFTVIIDNVELYYYHSSFLPFVLNNFDSLNVTDNEISFG